MLALAFALSLAAQEARPYRLPWEEGTAWLVGQGGMSQGTHRGKWAYDVMMPEGTPVCAARAGRVAGVKQDTPDPPAGKPGTGRPNWIVIDHGDGTEAQYVHIKNGSARVKPGDRVEQGQVICLSGNTGVSPIPHLHLEMKRADGSTFEPAFEDVEGDGKLVQGRTYASGNVPGVPQAAKDKLSALARAAKLAEAEDAWGLAYLAWKRFAGEKLEVKYRRQDEARRRMEEIEAMAARAEPTYRTKLVFAGVPVKGLETVLKPAGRDPWEDFYRALKHELEGKTALARTAYGNILLNKPPPDLRARVERRLAALKKNP